VSELEKLAPATLKDCFSVDLAQHGITPEKNQKAPQGGCGHRRQHARLR